MSGGSYNYLYIKESYELFEFGRRDCLADMRDRLIELGYPDAAAGVTAVIDAMDDYEKKADALMSPIRDVMQAVEWLDSNDWGEDQLRAEVAKYRATLADPTKESRAVAEIPPELITDTRAFLANLAGSDDEARLCREVELTAGGYEEADFARTALAALLLLKRWIAADPTEES